MARIFIIAVLLGCSFCMCGQTITSDRQIAENIIGQLKRTNVLGYSFNLQASFPNGQTDKFSGEVFIDNGNKLMYNNSAAQTLLYSKDWYYRADHLHKSVTVIHLDKHFKKEEKEELEKQVFGNERASSFIDSSVLKYAIINKVSIKKDTVNISLSFPKDMLIRAMDFVYDQKEKLPVSCAMRMFRPAADPQWKGKGTEQVIYCNHYTRKPGKGCNADNFFKVSGKNVTLKKFNKYKLYTQL